MTTTHHRCPGPCTTGRRRTTHYLCPTCWRSLPLQTQAGLSLRDTQAHPRLQELLAQISAGTPLHNIQVTP